MTMRTAARNLSLFSARLRQPCRLVGIVIWAIGHGLAVWAARRDAQFVDVVRRHLRYPPNLRT